MSVQRYEIDHGTEKTIIHFLLKRGNDEVITFFLSFKGTGKLLLNLKRTIIELLNRSSCTNVYDLLQLFMIIFSKNKCRIRLPVRVINLDSSGSEPVTHEFTNLIVSRTS